MSPASAAEPVPGDACTTAGVYMQSGGPEVAGGGHFLVCDGSVWKSVVDYSATTGRVDVDIANDTGSCTAAKTGRLRYDDSGDAWEYCDGSDPWKPLGTGGSSGPDCTDDSSVLCTLDATRSNDDPQFTAANIKDGVNILGVTGSLVATSGAVVVDFKGPTDCPEIGDLCSDNSIYIGLHPTLNEWLFTTSGDEGQKAWYTPGNSNDTGSADFWEGRANQQWIAANRTIADYPAFNGCAARNTASHLGHNDWYLPSRGELTYVALMKSQLDSKGNMTLRTSAHWSSTQSGATLAWGVIPGNGNDSSTTKSTNTYYARCIRREAPPDATACVPNPLCPAVGDVCDDSNAGTTNDPIFAGFMIYNDPNSADVGECKPLFVTTADQSTGIQWKTSRGVDDIAIDAHDDGKLNDAQIADSATYPAFKLCKDLSDGGFGDWYLPARSELDLIWLNKSVIPGITGFTYFSSTESTVDYARVMISGDGYTGGQDNMYYKNVNMRARCVRRD